MKRPLLLAALLLTLTGGAAMAQQPNARYDYNRPPQYGGPAYGNGNRYDSDRRQDLFQLRQLDQLVDLNRRQKKDLLTIENYYDRELAQAFRNPGAQQQLLWQKSQDVISVLSPAQRSRLFAYEQYRTYNRSGYAYNQGSDWTPPTGRRW